MFSTKKLLALLSIIYYLLNLMEVKFTFSTATTTAAPAFGAATTAAAPAFGSSAAATTTTTTTATPVSVGLTTVTRYCTTIRWIIE